MYPEKIIRDLGIWRRKPRIEDISSGYTNRNFFIRDAERSFYGRVAEDIPRHGISRRNEAICLRLAAQANVAPPIAFLKQGVLVTHAIDGHPLAPHHQNTQLIQRIGQLLARVHRIEAPTKIRPYDVVKCCRSYLRQIQNHTIITKHRRVFESILREAPPLTGQNLIHGDAFNENFIDDGHRLWLIDWEYAGRGDPAVDLAFVAMNFDLDAKRIQTLTEAHDGGVEATKVAALVPIARLRDALWCLAELQAARPTKSLVSYAQSCLTRLNIHDEP